MDAVLATIVDGGWAILLKTQRLIEKNYLSFILKATTVFSFAAASANPLDGSLAHWIVQIHQIHAAWRANGSATMVGIFIALFVGCGGWFRDLTSSLYVKKYQEITLWWG
jgi:hypothetical protein